MKKSFLLWNILYLSEIENNHEIIKNIAQLQHSEELRIKLKGNISIIYVQ